MAFKFFNPRFRLEKHVEYLKSNITITDENDKKNFDEVYASFTQTAKKLGHYQKIRMAVFILLYISLISAVLNSLNFTFAQWLIQPFVAVTSVLGAGILGLAVLGMNYVINLLLVDLLSEHSHLIAILVKNNTEFIAHPDYKLGLIKKYESLGNSE